jgi:POT family proton-dependent oligopeptide transporter
MKPDTSTATEPAGTGNQTGRFPPQIKFIIGNEACERFSYYGMLGILELYLLNRMGLGKERATEVLHLFATAVYFLPLVGGWLADRWLGRYWTILSISLFYCLGHGTLALFEGSRAGLYTGLALLAIGAGGIKPCVSAFVGDQFGPNQERALTKVYGWFYWAINFGAAFGFFVIPLVRQNAGYSWAFGIPGIFMGFATVVFWLGTKHYVRQPPSRNQKQAGFLPVLWYSLVHGKERKAGESFVDAALTRFTLQEVQGAKAVLGILTVFATVPAFWALFNQVNSTWVVQGKQMTPYYLLDGETMQSAGSVLVMIWVPVLTFGVYPLLERLGVKPTPLRRMSAGMLLGGVSFVISGLIQSHLDKGETLSIAWQLAPYVVLEAGEVMVSATGLEFAFAQSPPAMKSIVMSFWLMTISLGHFLIALFTNLNANFVHAEGAAEFYFYAFLMFLATGGFMICATRYRKSDFVVP